VTTRNRVTIAITIYLLLGSAIVVLSYWKTVHAGKTFDEFNKTAGIGMTLLTSLFAGVISLIVSKSQQQAAAELEQSKGAIVKEVNRENETFKAALAERLNDQTEKLKASLALQVGQQIETIKLGFNKEIELLRSSLAKEMARETETLKNNLATNLEFLKARFGLERDAFRLLSEAANHYYYALAELERGTFEQDNVDKADEMMVDASSSTSNLLDDRPKVVWFDLWQVARGIKEQAQKNASDKTALVSLWNQRGPELGRLISDFEEIATLAYRGLPSSSATTPSAAET
jgi:hypothetical protein